MRPNRAMSDVLLNVGHAVCAPRYRMRVIRGYCPRFCGCIHFELGKHTAVVAISKI